MTVHTIFRDRLSEVLAELGRGAMKELAYKSGYSAGYIRGLAANGRNPTIGAVWAIAQALDVCPFWLLGKGEKHG